MEDALHAPDDAFSIAVGATDSSPAHPMSLSASLLSHRKPSTSSLPVELWAIIFREVYRSCTLDRSHAKWNPFTLASVCPLWGDAMSLAPEFWTNIMILLDVSYFSVASITSILVRSHNLILESVTCTRNDWSAVNDEFERTRAMTVMQVIAPHIHRCRAITFNVRFSSSLPSFPNDFHGNAEHLKTLQLGCLEDDGGVMSTNRETNLLPIHREPFQFPNLQALVIDGRNYYNAHQQNVNWTETLPLLHAIFISHFIPVTTRSESFTTSDLIYSLVPLQNRLKFFGIRDLHLNPSPIPILNDDAWFFELGFDKLTTIVLEDMHIAACVGEILDVLGEQVDLHITRCPLHLAFNSEGNLSLRDIDGGENLISFLTGCSSPNLFVDGCPGFTDDVLDAMVSPKSATGLYMPPLCAPDVEDLSISNCQNFSISALKRMVRSRYLYSNVRGPDNNVPVLGVAHICVLRLSGLVPVVSLEDREWFTNRVDEFSYSPAPDP